MKKTKLISLLLCTVLVISFCACKSVDPEIKNKLCRTWQYDYYARAVGEHCHRSVTFKNDNSVVNIWVNDDAPSKTRILHGTYTIKSGKVVAKYEDGEKIEYEYTYENGTLRLFDGGTEFTR